MLHDCCKAKTTLIHICIFKKANESRVLVIHELFKQHATDGVKKIIFKQNDDWICEQDCLGDAKIARRGTEYTDNTAMNSEVNGNLGNKHNFNKALS